MIHAKRHTASLCFPARKSETDTLYCCFHPSSDFCATKSASKESNYQETQTWKASKAWPYCCFWNASTPSLHCGTISTTNTTLPPRNLTFPADIFTTRRASSQTRKPHRLVSSSMVPLQLQHAKVAFGLSQHPWNLVAAG